MRSRDVLLAGAIALQISISSGPTQEIGVPSRGLALALRLCSECHAAERQQARSPNESAPQFATIAATPGMTAMALSAALNTPHRSMPNVMLQADEQADIIAYILTLR